MSKKESIINSFSKNINKKNIKPISILILNAPCYGFGDVIFAYKLKRYLVKWYPFATIKIASTKTDNFLSIGEDPNSLIQLFSVSKEMQCRRFARLFNLTDDKNIKNIKNDENDKFDLIFVAPLQADYDPSYKDIKNLIPYSNEMNTYFFSEYNDISSKDIDFHTGIGRGKYGLLFEKIPSSILNNKSFLKSKELKKGNFAVCYIANTIVNMRQCYQSFFEMVSKKYMSEKFSIIIPPSLISDIIESQTSLKKLYKYFSTIVLVMKDGDTIFEDLNSSNKNVLYIRADILPIKNTEMLSLIYNSVTDILVTGDQSITDVLSCCPKKNIWYQIAPWKNSFGRQLGLHMPQKYYKRKKTSCGTMTAIGLKSDYREFVKKYDFRKLAKPKLNRIINMAISNFSN
jgi:hypothetical protein